MKREISVKKMRNGRANISLDKDQRGHEIRECHFQAQKKALEGKPPPCYLLPSLHLFLPLFKIARPRATNIIKKKGVREPQTSLIKQNGMLSLNQHTRERRATLMDWRVEDQESNLPALFPRCTGSPVVLWF